MDDIGKVAVSWFLFLLGFIFLHSLFLNNLLVTFDTLSFIRYEVVPWIESTTMSLLGPCPLLPEESALSKFSDLKFYYGFSLWALVWHVWLSVDFLDRHKAVASHVLKWLMAMGFNLTALSCLQCDSAKGFYWPLIMNCCNAWLVLVRFPGRVLPPRVEGDESIREYTAHSIYDDLSASRGQMRLIFSAQVTLCCVVIFQSYAKYHTNSITLGFWLLACSCVQIPAFLNRGVDSQVGRTWPLEEFRALMRINKNQNIRYRFRPGQQLQYTNFEMKERFVFGFIVNTLIRDVLIFMTPLVFMQAEDGMELVQNALALTFIATLDDLGEEKKVKIIFNYTPPDGSDLWAPIEQEVQQANEDSEKLKSFWADEWHRVWGTALMLAFPLAMWSFGFVQGVTLSPHPQPLWFAFWFLSFGLDCLIVLVPTYV